MIAVDRSPLQPALMKDDGVTFIKGDAFRYSPPWSDPVSKESASNREGLSWMVSDVVAYPERVVELVHQWGHQRWADKMIITMKFQGSEVDWNAIDEATAKARSSGYTLRAKHFFSNKNEVTLMLDGACI